MKPVTLLHFITWMSAESLVSSISENGVGGKPLSLCDSETLDKRLPVRSLDAGREMSSKIPRIISIVWLIAVFQKGTSTDTNSHVKKIYTHVPVWRVFFWNTAKKSCSTPTLSSSVHHAPIEFLSSVFRISGEIVRMVPLKFEFRDWKRVKPCVFHPLAVVTMDANRRASVEGNAPGTRMSSRLLSWSFNRCG